MIRPTPCRRCNGNVIPERDEWGQIEDVCLACGAREYPDRPLARTIEEEKALMKLKGLGQGKSIRDALPVRPVKLDKIRQLRLVEAE